MRCSRTSIGLYAASKRSWALVGATVTVVSALITAGLHLASDAPASFGPTGDFTPLAISLAALEPHDVVPTASIAGAVRTLHVPAPALRDGEFDRPGANPVGTSRPSPLRRKQLA